MQNAKKETKYDNPKYSKSSPKMKKELIKKQSQLISPIKLPQTKVQPEIKDMTNVQVIVTRQYERKEGNLDINNSNSDTETHYPDNIVNPTMEVILPWQDPKSQIGSYPSTAKKPGNDKKCVINIPIAQPDYFFDHNFTYSRKSKNWNPEEVSNDIGSHYQWEMQPIGNLDPLMVRTINLQKEKKPKDQVTERSPRGIKNSRVYNELNDMGTQIELNSS